MLIACTKDTHWWNLAAMFNKTESANSIPISYSDFSCGLLILVWVLVNGDVVVVIKMGAYIHGVLFFYSRYIISWFYGISLKCFTTVPPVVCTDLVQTVNGFKFPYWQNYFEQQKFLNYLGTSIRHIRHTCSSHTVYGHILRMTTVVWSNSSVWAVGETWFRTPTTDIIQPDPSSARSIPIDEDWGALCQSCHRLGFHT